MPPILALIFDTTSTPRLARVPAIGQNLPFVQRYPSCSTRPQNAQPMDLVWLAAGLPIFAVNARVEHVPFGAGTGPFCNVPNMNQVDRFRVADRPQIP